MNVPIAVQPSLIIIVGTSIFTPPPTLVINHWGDISLISRASGGIVQMEVKDELATCTHLRFIYMGNAWSTAESNLSVIQLQNLQCINCYVMMNKNEYYGAYISLLTHLFPILNISKLYHK
ncbi:hypothetical protein BDQ17DRAFT_1330587 [Cyathus striatus]|nr:hypothetical protein BDQ17DRAFT_1330587 [Cyathus striatus]